MSASRAAGLSATAISLAKAGIGQLGVQRQEEARRTGADIGGQRAHSRRVLQDWPRRAPSRPVVARMPLPSGR